MGVDAWARRQARARELAALWPVGAEALRLLEALTGVQAELAQRLGTAIDLEPGAMASEASGVIVAIATCGPAAVAARAVTWQALGWRELEKRLTAFWFGVRGDPLDDGLAKLLLQPYAAALAASGAGECPFCATRPAVSLLREDREAGALARTLVCSVCFAERGFARVLCPACGEERPEKLPRLSAEEIPWIRIEACDACGRYLKAIDLTRCAEAEPIADELGSVVLDAVALERDYVKVAPNLAGL